MARLLGIDIGTSACKAALFDCNGSAVAQASVPCQALHPRPGWAQQRPDDWWRAACDCVKAIAEQVSPADIAGIGVAGQSGAAVLVDADGRALLDTPLWMDARTQPQCDEINQALGADRAFSLCGNPTMPAYSLPKLLWYRQNAPDAWSRAACVLQSNSFIAYRLTGRLSQDVSQGYGFSCFDIRRGRWDEDAIHALGLRGALFPPVFGCGDVIGYVSADAAYQTGLRQGIPVVAGGLDAACAALGAGVVTSGQAQEQGGQAGGMSICMDDYAADPRLILSRHVAPGRWLLQGGTVGGGGTLHWLRGRLFPDMTFEEMSALASSVPPGSDGLLFLPYMAGERSPIWNPNATGVFFGMDYAKTKAHIIRACMEGVAYSLRHNLAVAKEAGAYVGTLNATGGSTNSAVWTQIKADVTARRIDVPENASAAWGAAMLAGVGAGVLDNLTDAAGNALRVRRSHSPSPENQALYDAGYARYIELYERLKPMMPG